MRLVVSSQSDLHRARGLQAARSYNKVGRELWFYIPSRFQISFQHEMSVFIDPFVMFFHWKN